MKPLFKKRILATLCLSILSQAAIAADDLLISEYVEGSSYNKAIELFNETDSTIDLSNYQLEYYFNGNTSAGRTIQLSGSLDNNEVFVIAQDRADPALRDLANQTDTSTSWFNGDDAVVLSKGGVVIDSIGQIGSDPGSEWGSGETSTKDNTLQRKVFQADIDPFDSFDPAEKWNGFPKNTFTGIGNIDGAGIDDGEEEVLPVQQVKIHDIQGQGAESPLVGQVVSVEAVITADFIERDQLNGFFIQEERSDWDSNDLTSEGLFVYAPGLSQNVSVGDKIKVSGTVAEFFGLTQLKDVTVTLIETGLDVSVSEVSLPFASIDAMERFEGMLVSIPQNLSVTENYTLGRYGEFWLSSGGRLYTPTNIVAPGEDALAVQQVNDLNRILVDDFSTQQNPDPVIYPEPELSAFNTLRSGNQISNLQGVVHYGFGNYRIQPTESLEIIETNDRTLEPESVNGSLKVASFNVHNFFNGDGQGGGFPTSRGADNAEELDRQKAKIVEALVTMSADIIGLMEIENDGYGEFSAIAELVSALNETVGEVRFGFVNPNVSQIGTDEIAVGFLYNIKTVQLKGNAAILDSSVDANFNDDKNRPALAQTFVEKATNGVLTLAVNHLKSKGSSCESLDDPDLNDGQGNCNQTRTKAAEALVEWLANDPTNSGDVDRLIIGDLNAYAKEDPISAIKNAGYSDLIDENQEGAYSYVFKGQSGYLDHALSSENLTVQVNGVSVWHINADEPISLDYNTEFKSENQVITFYNSDAYRSSDHDPIIIGFNLQSDLKEASHVSIESMTAENVIETKTYSRRGRSYEVTQRTVTVSVEVANDLNAAVEGSVVNGQWIMRNHSRNDSCVTDEVGQCQIVLKTRDLTYPTKFVVTSIDDENLSYNPEGNETNEVNLND